MNINPDQIAAEGMQKQLEEECKAIAKRLGLDSVVMFATWRAEAGGTRSLASMVGNYFANFGVVSQWLTRQEETDRIFQRRVYREHP